VGNTGAQFTEPSRGGVRGARFLSPANNVQVGLSVLVERGRRRELRTRVAEQQIEAAEAQVLDTLRTQLFQLRQVFLGALLARANLEVALGNRAALDRTEALLRRQLRDGAVPESDLLRFQASRLPFEADVTSNAQSYAAGVAAVAALLTADPAAFRPAPGRSRPWASTRRPPVRSPHPRQDPAAAPERRRGRPARRPRCGPSCPRWPSTYAAASTGCPNSASGGTNWAPRWRAGPTWWPPPAKRRRRTPTSCWRRAGGSAT
jgi:outer membrane protein TolC